MAVSHITSNLATRIKNKITSSFQTRPASSLLKGTIGGPRGRVVKVADFSALDHSIISPLLVGRIHMWDEPTSACGCVRWFFNGYSGFRPTFCLIRLGMSEKA